MADTGYNWDAAWAAVQKSAADWTADDLTDTSTEVSDAISLDGYAVMEFSITVVEDNTGAIDGNVIVTLLGDCDGANYEEVDQGNPYEFEFLPKQNDTVRVRFRVLGCDYSSLKISIENDAGQTLSVTVKQRGAKIPLAS